MKKFSIILLAIIVLLVIVGGVVFFRYSQEEELAQSRAVQSGTNTTQTLANLVTDETNGVVQAKVMSRGVLSPQTGTQTVQTLANLVTDETNGWIQIALDSSSEDLIFTNFTSLTDGDITYYDSTGEEWLNTQGQISVSGIGTSPAITGKNPTAENIANGREFQIRAKGIQSGGEESTLGYISFDHDGTSDDQKGRFAVYVNDGNDNDAPTVRIQTLSTGITYFNGGTNTTGNVTSTSYLIGSGTVLGGLYWQCKTETLNDDASTTTFQSINRAGFGQALIGDAQEYAQFVYTAAGVVTLTQNSANVTNADTDANLCIYSSGSNGVVIKNRLGSALTVKVCMGF